MSNVNTTEEVLVAEKANMIVPSKVCAASALLGGLYVAGLTKCTLPKLAATAGATYLGYVLGEEIERRAGEGIEATMVAGGIGMTLGMLASGAGGCLESSNAAVDLF